MRFYKEKFQDLLLYFVKILQDKIVVHPYFEKCHTIARHVILELYKKCLPYIAQISENSVLAGGLGFGLGILISYWIFSIYYKNYNVIKSRTMSGVTFDSQYGGFDSLHLKSDLIVPRITQPNQVLVRIHAASIDLTGNITIGGTLTYEDVKNVGIPKNICLKIKIRSGLRSM